MTNRLLPVNASMKSATSGPGRNHPQRQCGELKAGDPAFRALLEGVDLCGVEVQAHRLVEELLRLTGGEAEIGAADFDELPSAAQPSDGQRRVGPGGDQQVQLDGQVVEKEGHGLVHLGCRTGRGSRPRPGPTAPRVRLVRPGQRR
jgi:hypothetical protein